MCVGARWRSYWAGKRLARRRLRLPCTLCIQPHQMHADILIGGRGEVILIIFFDGGAPLRTSHRQAGLARESCLPKMGYLQIIHNKESTQLSKITLNVAIWKAFVLEDIRYPLHQLPFEAHLTGVLQCPITNFRIQTLSYPNDYYLDIFSAAHVACVTKPTT